MKVVRQRVPERYTVVDNTSLEDARVSYRAAGLLAYLLSRPDGWETDSDALSKPTGREGRDAVRTALNELEGAGYIARTKSQDAATGRWSTVLLLKDAPTPENPSSGIRRLENRPSDIQALSTSSTETKNYPPTPQEEAVNEAINTHIGDIGELAAECSVLRREQGLPTARWTAPRVRRAIVRAIETGCPPAYIAAALRVVATDPATQTPGRLPTDGPWWSIAEGDDLKRRRQSAAALARDNAAAARRSVIAGCPRCDDDGRIWSERRSRHIPCDHLADDDATVTA